MSSAPVLDMKGWSEPLLRIHRVWTYLPTLRAAHKRSDRTINVDTPLFPGYLFFRSDGSNEELSNVRRTRGAVSILVANRAAHPFRIKRCMPHSHYSPVPFHNGPSPVPTGRTAGFACEVALWME